MGLIIVLELNFRQEMNVDDFDVVETPSIQAWPYKEISRTQVVAHLFIYW